MASADAKNDQSKGDEKNIAMSSTPKHNCTGQMMAEVFALGYKIIERVDNKDLKEDDECPYCLASFIQPAESCLMSCSCGKSPARLQCKHLVHVGCYLTMSAEGKPECPICRHVPVKQLSDEDKKREIMKTVPVPDVIELLELRSLQGNPVQFKNISSSLGIGKLVPAEHRDRIQLLSFSRLLDYSKKLSDYPGIHLSFIAINIRM